MTRLKPLSDRRRRRQAEAKPVREQLISEVRMCEVCLRKRDPHLLCCHEISNGPLRQASLDKRFAILVVCLEPIWRTGEVCHATVQAEPEARQLARLKLVRERDYDRLAYLEHTNPRAMKRITEAEVEFEIEQLLKGRGETCR